MADVIFKLKIDPNLVVFGFHCKFQSWNSRAMVAFCDFRQWLTSKMADNMISKMAKTFSNAWFNLTSYALNLPHAKKIFSPRVLKILKIQSFGQKIDFKPVKYFFKAPSKRYTSSSSMEPRGPFKSELNSIHIACKSIGRKEFFTN